MEKIILTREECLRLMNQYGMLENIIDHSIEVANVALYLSAELNKKGQRIDLPLVEAASLLHDLTKTPSFKTREDHAWTASRLLKEMGYEKVGEVVAQHIWLSHEVDPLFVSEEEVVNYADKRVMHDRIVSLDERFNDLRDRYGRDQKGMDYLGRMEKVIQEIEKKIFLILQVSPNDLQNLPRKQRRQMETSFEQGQIRPPSEAYSLLIRVTRNCPLNRCEFCHTYKREKFSVRSVEEVCHQFRIGVTRDFSTFRESSNKKLDF